MKKTYLFYDLETTGLNKCFDQVLQYASIRTDLQFNEVERKQLFVKLNPDVIPSPRAMITHRISLDRLVDAETEFSALQTIHADLNQPGTISLGYNTLEFDDEFLRFSFYRNLLAPYTHQFANQCQRMDIYPLTVMYYLYNPDVFVWPEVEGRLSLKLEELAKANGFARGAAHDALVDVEMTIELARRLSQHQEMWQYLTEFFTKQTDLQRQSQLKSEAELGRCGLLIEPKFGNNALFQAPVLALGQHKHYTNQILWLHLDKPELLDTTVDNLIETTWVSQKKSGSLGFCYRCNRGL